MKALKHSLKLVIMGWLAVGLLGTVGCESFSKSSPGSLTSVKIVNQPLSAVQAAVSNVFLAHEFTGGFSGTNQFTFRRPGTSLDQVAYGSRLFERPLTVKVVVTIQSPTPDVITVGCKAWIIESESNFIFQEIHPVRSWSKGPYKKLLEEVQTQASRGE